MQKLSAWESCCWSLTNCHWGSTSTNILANAEIDVETSQTMCDVIAAHAKMLLKEKFFTIGFCGQCYELIVLSSLHSPALCHLKCVNPQIQETSRKDAILINKNLFS